MKKLFSLLTLALLTSSAWAGTYAKVTSTADLTDGTYLIVYEAGNLAFDGSLETLDAAGNTFGVTIENGTIITTDDTKAFTIDMTAGTIMSASGFYIGRTADSNGMNTSKEALVNTISIDNDGNAVIVAGGAYLRYNASSGQERFRYFKSSTYTAQKAIALYKLGGTPGDPVDPTYTEVTTLDGANALDDNTEFIFKGDAVVTYQYGRYLYLRDNSGYGLIYNTAGVEPTFNNGDVLAQEWTAKKTTYDGYAEYTDYSALSANGTNANLAAPQVITALSADMLNAYVQINNVVSISGTTATLSNGTTIALYKRFDATIPAFENGNYYITGIVSQHKGNLQLLYIGSNYEAPVEDDITTLAQANALDDATQFTFKGNAVVTYQKGKYLYLRDNSGYGLIYNQSANIEPTFNNGDVLAQGWSATKTTYQGYAEYTDYSTLSANGTDATLAAPQVITALSADMLNAYVQINNVVSMSKSGKTATLADGTTIALHTTFAQLDDIENGNFSMTGIVSQYNGNLQLLLIAHDYEAPTDFVAAPVITPNGGEFANQVEVSMTCATEGAEIIYTINGGDEITYNGPFTLTESATVKAYAQTDDAESEMTTAEFTIVKIEEATYTLVTDASKLADGDKIILVSAGEAGEAYAMGAAKTSNFNAVAVTIAENLTITTADANVITLGANGDKWTLKATEGYLYASSSTKNELKAEDEIDDNAIASIAIADTAAVTIVFQGENTHNYLRYNENVQSGVANPLFSCYAETSSVKAPVYIYKAESAAPEVKLGDVNKDGKVNIADVTALIDALLSGDTTTETESYSPANSDVNQEGGVNIADVTALIDMLLSGNV